MRLCCHLLLAVLVFATAGCEYSAPLTPVVPPRPHPHVDGAWSFQNEKEKVNFVFGPGNTLSVQSEGGSIARRFQYRWMTDDIMELQISDPDYKATIPLVVQELTASTRLRLTIPNGGITPQGVPQAEGSLDLVREE